METFLRCAFPPQTASSTLRSDHRTPPRDVTPPLRMIIPVHVSPPRRPPRRSDLGLREYYPRFAAQGVETVDDLSRERKLDDLLETVGMDCNPGCAIPETCRLSDALLPLGARANTR